MNEVEQYANYLMHYGRSKRNGAPGRGSGRYPLGSGREPYQGFTSTEIYNLKSKQNKKFINRQTNKHENFMNKGKVFSNKHKNFTVGATVFKSSEILGKKWVSALMDENDFDWQEITYDSIKDKMIGKYTTVAEKIKKNPNAYQITGGNKYWNSESEKRSHSKGEITERDLYTTNPGYFSKEKGTLQNCAKCTATLELKLHNYDVSAGRQLRPSTADCMGVWFKGAKGIIYKNYIDAEKELKSYGPNTSGSLGYEYPNNQGGHEVHWTNNSKGIFEIQDAQSCRRFKSIKDLLTESGGDMNGMIDAFRLDNCEPDWDKMAQDSVIRKYGDLHLNKVRSKSRKIIADRYGR